MRRYLWLVVAFVAGALLVGCGAAQRPSAPEQAAIPLPSTWPQQLALAKDGSLWMTGTYGGITRLAPDGDVKSFDIDFDDGEPVDIVQGPDGAMWFAAIESVGRIDETGGVEIWPVDGYAMAYAITAGNGALWFTNEGRPKHIERLNLDGSTASLDFTDSRGSFVMTGIAWGPDGALWFTESGYGDAADGIGRMTTDGHYTSWPLSQRRATPVRITAGADGALWFTEQDAHAIGRITTDGDITDFPLRTGLSPYDITSGTDKALWFTANSCIGRITTSGELTAWPVRGAQRLDGIAAAPDGSFWLADDLASAVRHFTPPPGSVAPADACAPPTIGREAGATRATLVYRRDNALPRGSDWFTDARLRISRAGKDLFSEVVPPNPEGSPSYGVFGETSSFAVRDLDGDDEPEVMLELNWNGTHCCDWSRIYRYDAARNTYVPVNHMWGNGSAAPKLHDLDGDKRPEFVSQDDRFAYDFGGYAGSVRPIQIWSYERGIFSDVTRRYPGPIRRDAAELWRLYLKYRGKKDGNVHGILPAWAADEYMLGRGETVDPTLGQEGRQGYLDCTSADACFGEPRDAASYIAALKQLLRKTGYIAGAVKP
jgi:virginiamycin B lyase